MTDVPGPGDEASPSLIAVLLYDVIVVAIAVAIVNWLSTIDFNAVFIVILVCVNFLLDIIEAHLPADIVVIMVGLVLVCTLHAISLVIIGIRALSGITVALLVLVTAIILVAIGGVMVAWLDDFEVDEVDEA
ncbi:MAG: hypothetical protein M1826_007014 [Phylliscum demangeonii]|nr:MAG: hypothetical protein M1826_007014 [Phylliscum demangeonii]